MSKKVSKGLGIILKARKCLNNDTLLSLYYTFLYPYLTYCNHIWGNVPTSNLQKLIVLQKRAIRIISGVPPRTSTAPLFKKLNILDLQQLNKFLVGQLMFKYYIKNLPAIFDNFFIYNRDIHQYYTRQNDELHFPKVKTELGKRSLGFWGVKVWNAIVSIKMNLNVTPITFKNNLKKALLNGALSFPVLI